MSFRNDINGLRAIAVIAVLLFHFDASWMPGGFAGVDVFFVISGYLMTAIIFRGLEDRSFSLIGFYGSRANRIIPALAALCFVLLCVGWFYLVPSEYETLGVHTASSVAFLSNIVYWQEAGYFDMAARDKWLLHTWSLSVEWQFYILYPIILLPLAKFFSLETVKKLIVVGTILGLGISIVGTIRSADAAYYLFPTRAWEMLAGGGAYLYAVKLKPGKARALEITGLALILISYYLIDGADPWPGYLALLPVIGTFMVIQAGQQSSILTNNTVFQNIGKWSYSIYLWHWPIVVYFYQNGLSGWWISLSGIVVSIILGFLSYELIERRNFKRDLSTFRNVVKFVPVHAALAVIVFGAFVSANAGLVSRGNIPDQILANQQPDHYQSCFERMGSLAESVCVFHSDGVVNRTIDDKVVAIVIGDSHASSIVVSVVESFKQTKMEGDILFFGAPGCFPVNEEIRTIYNTNFTHDCNLTNPYIKSLVEAHAEAKVVFLARYSLSIWGHTRPGRMHAPTRVQWMSDGWDVHQNAEHLSTAWRGLMTELSGISELYVVTPIPEQRKNVPNTIARAYFRGLKPYPGVTVDSYQARNRFALDMIEALGASVKVIDPSSLLCDERYCRVLNEHEQLLYYDDNHLSIDGAKYVSELFDVIWN